MTFLESGTERGSGENADAAGIDSAGKAIDKAVERIQKRFVPDKPDKFRPGIKDDEAWWRDKFLEIGFTIEKSKEISSDNCSKAETDWKVTGGPVKRRSNRLPRGKIKKLGPLDPISDLCSSVFEEQGEFKTDFAKGFAKAQSVNKAIDIAKDRIKNYPGKNLQDRIYPANCPAERATLFVEVTEVGSLPDKVRSEVKWWLRIYCFEGHNEETRKISSTWLAVVVSALVVLWTMVVPGWIAKCQRIFDDVGVRQIALKNNLTQVLHDNQLKDADDTLFNLCKGDTDIAKEKACSEARRSVREEKIASKLQITGFRHNSTTLVFLISYLSLSAVLIFLAPQKTPIRWRVLPYTIAGYLPMFTWSLLRNQYHDDPSRTVIAYVNWDISPCSFLLQEFRILGIFIMLSVIWDKWQQYGEWDRCLRRERSRKYLSVDHRLAFRTRTVSGAFASWQLVSFCIGLALLPWTYEYWQDIVRSGDTRYLFSAVTMHMACAVTWFIATIPLWRSMHAWSRFRDKVLLKYRRKNDKRYEWVSELKPVGDVGLITSAAAVGLSFFIPIFRAFFG